jgi:hypothetical protein
MVADVTPAGTVQLWEPPVQEKVTDVAAATGVAVAPKANPRPPTSNKGEPRRIFDRRLRKLRLEVGEVERVQRRALTRRVALMSADTSGY